ncbi:hypothetical protein DL93DRAFT_2078281 [Clavulina sp. PMI_390]|nr:hypothetical protein DL93DRAFT_2078281 [Clavulina sp. PMI_390]
MAIRTISLITLRVSFACGNLGAGISSREVLELIFTNVERGCAPPLPHNQHSAFPVTASGLNVRLGDMTRVLHLLKAYKIILILSDQQNSPAISYLHHQSLHIHLHTTFL